MTKSLKELKDQDTYVGDNIYSNNKYLSFFIKRLLKLSRHVIFTANTTYTKTSQMVLF